MKPRNLAMQHKAGASEDGTRGDGRTRPLTALDLGRVIEIDAAIGGRRRPRFFGKRLEAALAEPRAYIYIGCEADGALHGFLQARLLEGEYGAAEPVALMDNIGVDPAHQGCGIGAAMMREFESILRHKKVSEVQTQADWHNRSITGFLAQTGFRLAPKLILEREVGYIDTTAERYSGALAEPAYKEKDYSDPGGDEPGALARDIVCCRSLLRDDLAALIRIDRWVMGRERRAYYERKVREVLEESGIRVSLAAEMQGQVVGFIMARADFGEFDRMEPTAVLDTLAVDPGFGYRMVGTALLSQLLANLTTLRLEIIRTEVGMDRFDILHFLMKNGFHASQELAFSLRLN